MDRGKSLQLDFESKREILTVSGLNREARRVLERGLGTVWVEGELSNVSRPSSGHMYWTLKDASAQIRCAMFRQANRSLTFSPEDGQQVLVRARVSLYEARGDYQLIVEYMEEAGEGLLRRRFEALKKKLAAEGLFDADRKQPLPWLPERIGVVTSRTGAALRDVLIALRRRFPATAVLVYPTSVQGESAAPEIVRALGLADARRDCDLLILTRGGGSLEDLWAFNEEIVARAVADVSIPIIVGVGHETDFTIADFVADVRAPTPSQAAELAVPEQSELAARLAGLADQQRRLVMRRLGDELQRHGALAHRLARAHPRVALQARQQRLDELEGRIVRGVSQSIAAAGLRAGRLASRIGLASPRRPLSEAIGRLQLAVTGLERRMRKRLERLALRVSLAERGLSALSPQSTLARGFAIVTRRDDGTVVGDSAAVSRGAGIEIRLAHGGLGATVDRVDAGED